MPDEMFVTYGQNNGENKSAGNKEQADAIGQLQYFWRS
jgi:hypothetical protein